MALILTLELAPKRAKAGGNEVHSLDLSGLNLARGSIVNDQQFAAIHYYHLSLVCLFGWFMKRLDKG